MYTSPRIPGPHRAECPEPTERDGRTDEPPRLHINVDNTSCCVRKFVHSDETFFNHIADKPYSLLFVCARSLSLSFSPSRAQVSWLSIILTKFPFILSVLFRCSLHLLQDPPKFLPPSLSPSFAEFSFRLSRLLLGALEPSSPRCFLGHGCPDVMPYHQDITLIPHVGRDVWFQHPPKLDLGVAN